MTRTTTPRAPKEVEEGTPLEEEVLAKEKSALDTLLGASEAKQIDVVKLKPRQGLEDGLKLTIRSLTDREFRDLSNHAEEPVMGANRRARRQPGEAETELNPSLFLRLIVAAGTVDPEFGNPQLTAKFNVHSGDQVVQKVFLPGEIAQLAEEIMNLSGFNDNNIEYVKN